VNYDSWKGTLDHIQNVRLKIYKVVEDLLRRSLLHDMSKLEAPEKEIYDKYTPLLNGMEYGSPVYRETISKMKVGVDHHYTNNRHHPEYFPDGINAMNLVDLIEMLCDWKAAGERHNLKPIDIFQSIEINAGRFKIDPQLKQILLNTATYLWYD